MTFPLTVIAGNEAKEQLAQHGWQPELFTALVGASGGAKLLGIAHLDRAIFKNFLGKAHHQMELYGSSIGSWRHAALASGESADAIEELQYRYLNQKWAHDDPRPTQEIVDSLCEWVLDGFLNEEAVNSIINNNSDICHSDTPKDDYIQRNFCHSCLHYVSVISTACCIISIRAFSINLV